MPFSECLADGIPEDIKKFRQIWCTIVGGELTSEGNDNLLEFNLKGKCRGEDGGGVPGIKWWGTCKFKLKNNFAFRIKF